MLEQFKHYYDKARMMQHYKFEGNGNNYTERDISDDLIWNVPIYDVVNRRYAAFSSLPEAIWYKEQDPKGNGAKFKAQTVPHDYDFAYMCYLFRLCGSGINYKPVSEDTEWHKSHGFGNFWVVDAILSGRYRLSSWLEQLPERKFSNNKGYIIPQFKKGLRNFILEDSRDLFDRVWNFIHASNVVGQKCEIYEVADCINIWLKQNGFNQQHFVATAFAMDIAEYYPGLVRRNSRVYIGSNAKKCLKLIFPDRKRLGNFEVINESLQELCEITGNHSLRYDMEDVACDFIRYINNYQSPDHIKLNGGVTFKNSL